MNQKRQRRDFTDEFKNDAVKLDKAIAATKLAVGWELIIPTYLDGFENTAMACKPHKAQDLPRNLRLRLSA